MQLFMPVTQKMMIYSSSSSSFVSLSSDKLRPPKLRDKEFPAGTARHRQERRQEISTAAPTVNCMSANCSAWRDVCSSFYAFKGIKHRAAKLVKLNEEIGVIILPTVFESERRPELLFGCLLIDQRTERAARSH